MNIAARIAVIVLVALCMTGAEAADLQKPPARAELRLVDGSNDVAVNGLTVRVVKAYVGTLTAHSYKTFTSFVLPATAGGTWLHVLVDQPDSDLPDFRTVESADSTVQAVAMYRDNGALFAVQATKEGLSPPDLYLNAAYVIFRVYRFNGNLDMALFKQEKVFKSASMYVNAGDALAKEFFKK